MSGGLPNVGRKSFRVRADNPRPVSRAEAAAELQVPTLDADNVFTGDNVFHGDLQARGTFTLDTADFVGELTNTDVTKNHTLAGNVNVGNLYSGGDVQGVDMQASGNITALGALVAGASFYAHLNALSGATTLDGTHFVVSCTGTWTLTLPAASGCSTRLYVVKNSGVGVITLATTGGDTIDGAAPGTVIAGAVVRLISDGASNWLMV